MISIRVSLYYVHAASPVPSVTPPTTPTDPEPLTDGAIIVIVPMIVVIAGESCTFQIYSHVKSYIPILYICTFMLLMQPMLANYCLCVLFFTVPIPTVIIAALFMRKRKRNCKYILILQHSTDLVISVT